MEHESDHRNSELPQLKGYILRDQIHCFSDGIISLCFSNFAEDLTSISNVHLVLTEARIHHATVNILPRSDGPNVPKVTELTAWPIPDSEGSKNYFRIDFPEGDIQLSYRELFFTFTREKVTGLVASSRTETKSDGS